MEKTKPGYSALGTLLSCDSACSGHLKSNSPRLMDEAVLALRNLAHQCSDSSAMEALTRHLFAILGGEQAFLVMGMADMWPPAFLGHQDLTGTQCSDCAWVKAVWPENAHSRMGTCEVKRSMSRQCGRGDVCFIFKYRHYVYMKKARGKQTKI